MKKRNKIIFISLSPIIPIFPFLTRIIHAVIVPIVFLCFISIAAGGEIEVRFETANQAYRSNDYEKAARLYQEILSQGYENAALYYNLGNCYYKLKSTPSAILQYERARRFDPSDEDIAHNLSLANLRIVDRVEAIPELFYITWWHQWTDLASADRWAAIGILSLWLALICIIVLYFRFPFFLIRRIFSLFALIAFASFVLCMASAADRYIREENDRYAVVFAASTQARSAPDQRSTNLFVLHEGVKVQLLDQVGGWNKIRLADGKIGWIESSSFRLI